MGFFENREKNDNGLTVARIYAELSNQKDFPGNHAQPTLKDRMFSEIVHRSIADVSGHLNLGAQHLHPKTPQDKQRNDNQVARVTIGKVFDSITSALSASGINGIQTLNFFLGNLTGYSKGIVQTPHPTEMLSKEAIKAEEDLLNALEHEGKKLFTGKRLDQVEIKDRHKISEALDKLYQAITPVMEPLKIEEEMDRSIRFSERMFDAVPMIANRILASSRISSTDLTKEQRAHFAHLVEPLTWSPGDQDSKPDMKIDEMEMGFHKNRRAMMKHYTKQLLEITQEHFEHTPDQMIKIAARMLASAKAHETRPDMRPKSDDAYVHSFAFDEDKLKINTSTEALQAITRELSTAAPYETKEALIADLENLRAAHPTDSRLNYDVKLNGDDVYLGTLDALIIQAQNFGLNALSSQIRQNRDVHERVFTMLLEMLPEKVQKAENTGAAALDYLADPDHLAGLQASVKEKLHIIGTHDYAKNLVVAREKNKENEFYFYQTMKTLEFAARHSDFIPHYLIAECGYDEKATDIDAKAHPKHGVQDMLSVLALLKVVEPGDVKTPVEIVPLVEHPEQVLEKDGKIPYVEMMKEVLSNQYFRAHQQKVSDAQYRHLLTHTTVENQHIIEKPLTGTDILASTNPEFGRNASLQPNEAPVGMAKLCMGAGSDVTKFGGISAAGLMQHTMHRLKEELALMKEPVLLLDYIGCGGGVHRTQPVSNSFETVQGRSMRQTADAIATKITALLARNMRDRLAGPTARIDRQPGNEYAARRNIPQDERKLLVQLNLGNIANLPRNPSAYEQFSKAILQQATRNYMEYTNTSAHPEFTELLSYSADMFCKLTSFAARPLKRLSGQESEKSFPLGVEMDKLRAIGYGGALNASGSSASLYLGLANALKDVSTKALANVYQYDPILQDTLNRATYGIAMADLETAWRYLGEPYIPSHETLQQLEKQSPQRAQRMELAKKALAHITLEYEQLGKKLIELHAIYNHQQIPPVQAISDIAGTLTGLLPKALAYQIESSRNNIKPAREALAAIFQEELKKHHDAAAGENPTTPPPITRQSPNYENTIYPAMGAIFECYEHTPRAYTSPHWAMGQSKPYALGLVA